MTSRLSERTRGRLIHVPMRNLNCMTLKEREWLEAAGRGAVETLRMSASLWPELLNSQDEAGHSDTVALLVDENAELNGKDETGWTALMMAAACGHDDVVELLVSKRADVNLQAKDGASALMLAAEKGHSKIVVTLLRWQAEVNATTHDGLSALMLAAQNGHFWAVSVLLREKADVNAETNVGVTALMFAAQSSEPEIVALLLQKGASVNAKRRNGMTALMSAAQHGQPDIVALLLREKAEVNAKAVQGVTALTLAAQNGHPEVVALLLREQTERDPGDTQGITPLMRAAQNGHPDVAALLLEGPKPADANAAATGGWTALMFAAANGRLAVAVLLLQHGADSSLSLPNGTTACSVASKRGHTEIVDLLEGKTPALLAQQQSYWMDTQKTTWRSILELLRSGAVALWPLSVLRLLSEKGCAIPPRQQVAEVLKGMGMDEGKVQKTTQAAIECAERNFPLMGNFSVVCLSFAWLSHNHPDPNRFHLQLLARELEKHWWAQGECADRVFIFWDFMSLHQNPRTESEDLLFQKALESLDLFYSSSHTRVFRSIGVPPESPNPLPYNTRGWPTFETCVIGFKPSRLTYHLPTSVVDENSPSSRRRLSSDGFKLNFPKDATACIVSPADTILPPHSPNDFNLLLESKTFTNGADGEVVKELYRQFVHRTAGSVQHVSFAGRSGFSDANAVTLCGLFQYLQQVALAGMGDPQGGNGEWGCLRQLDLSWTQVTDRGAEMLIETLGDVKSLRRINLSGTQISVGTLRALQQTFERGGMTSLGTVNLFFCRRLSKEVTDREVDIIVAIARMANQRGKKMSLKLTKSLEALSDSGRASLQEGVKGFEAVELVL
uniref:Uncharacterized protein n=1 Tax=Chromera velia CCMP2878 TaxID=1169474 RepID=A0A0G4I9B6_9ALVE|eukprot:Cvel_12214.t1-p1 / transcript=Cvel_12214.t1 / gene=Cvel_12214 / organism=Chromera_velia_CCMP2878 / gene_product=Ankyrin repeat domain-containing protein 50, putative / transcript_product=Ankyrin repeat domain-containing protein 50, putative / location=Cvel_scaffold790:17454-20846(-) / protein_length=842 / sequence_SO=supercontig / SO=protein_coding / is_pseudo=false